MKKLIIVLSAFMMAFSGVAHANKIERINKNTERTVWNPPARFDHPYHGHLVIHRLSQSKIPEACEKLLSPLGINAHLNQKGCSFYPNNRSCTVIIIDKPYNGTTPAAVLRHEIGHCNGWPSNHPK